MAYQFAGSLRFNDDLTLADLASDYDDRTCDADAESANLGLGNQVGTLGLLRHHRNHLAKG